MEKQNQVEPNAGGYRKCPDCGLSFRHEEMFDQHRSIGCKPPKTSGDTWSKEDIDGSLEETESGEV